MEAAKYEARGGGEAFGKEQQREQKGRVMGMSR